MKHKIIFGFTLLEITLVIFLMILVTIFVIPQYSFFLRQSKNQAMISQLLRAINLTRTAAIAHGEATTLCSSSDAKSCSGQWQDGYIVKINQQVLFTFRNNIPGVLHWRSFQRTEGLQFLPTGFPNTNGTFWFCEKNAALPSWAIVLNQAGRARLIYPQQAEKILDDKGAALSC